jgi:aminopeptidase YwaD
MKTLRPTLIALVLAPLVPACSAPGHPEASHASGSATAPEAGRLAQDVRWLADDKRDGRRAGTPGEAQAAHWIAQRLEALGFAPAGSDGYLQPFEVPLPARAGGSSGLTVNGSALPTGDDALVPLFCSSAGEVEGALVFGGYGIASEDVLRDDFSGLDVEGKVVLLVRGTPPDALLPAERQQPAEVENPHGGPVSAGGWAGTGSIFRKVMEARQRGALGVVVAQHPGRDEAMLRFGEGGAQQARIPALLVSSAAAELLMPGYAEAVTGLDAGEAPAALQHAGLNVALRADVLREKGTATNVLGRLAGADSSRVIVIGAHFDHLGRGGDGSLAPEALGEVHNGADDNASGTATVLELARCLAAGPRPAQDVVVALWSGEELGLLGSEHWARNPTFPLEQVAFNVNLDMVGRAGAGKVSVLGAGSAGGFSGWLSHAGPLAGLELEVSLSGQGMGGSDHQTFLKRSIPALHFFSGIHSDYHRPSDDYERFEADGARRVAAIVLDVLAQAGRAAPATMTWQAPPEGEQKEVRGGFKTRFGSIPDYAFSGQGMRLDGTSAGGPAERAGLLRGDVITAMNDTAIEGVEDFMFVLNTHKPGDVMRVTYQRDGEEETCMVTLVSSQIE